MTEYFYFEWKSRINFSFSILKWISRISETFFGLNFSSLSGFHELVRHSFEIFLRLSKIREWVIFFNEWNSRMRLICDWVYFTNPWMSGFCELIKFTDTLALRLGVFHRFAGEISFPPLRHERAQPVHRIDLLQGGQRGPPRARPPGVD